MSVDIPMYPHQCKKLAVSYCWEYFDNVASKLPARVGNSSISVLENTYKGPVPPIRTRVVTPLGTIFQHNSCHILPCCTWSVGKE